MGRTNFYFAHTCSGVVYKSNRRSGSVDVWRSIKIPFFMRFSRYFSSGSGIFVLEIEHFFQGSPAVRLPNLDVNVPDSVGNS